MTNDEWESTLLHAAMKFSSVPHTNVNEARAALIATARQVPREALACTCGSGAHPRRCTTHPQRYEAHCNELSLEYTQSRVEELEAENADLTKRLAELERVKP